MTTINPAYRTSELAFTLQKVGVKAVVAAEHFKSSDYLAMLDEAEAPALQHRIKLGLGRPARAGSSSTKSPGCASAKDLAGDTRSVLALIPTV